MKKIIIILMFIYFLTGCAVSSEITIDKDLNVQEQVKMTGTSEFFSRYSKSLPITTVNMLLDGNRKETLLENGYTYYIDKTGNYPVVVATKNYSSIDSFVKNTIFKKQYFENFETYQENNLVTIKADDFIEFIEGDIELYEISNFSLKIKIPFIATEHNADDYDPKTNTYIWHITDETLDKEINLTFDKTKIYVYNLVMYISIFILSILVIILIFVGFKLTKKSKINNKIIE